MGWPNAAIPAAAGAWAWSFSRERRRRNISRAKRCEQAIVQLGAGTCSGRRDDGGARSWMAGRLAARSGGPWPGSGFYTQAVSRLSAAGSASRWPVRCVPSLTANHWQPPRIPQRGRRGRCPQENVLIEKDILRGFCSTNYPAACCGPQTTGSGRRESYQHIPMPRMTNTFMLAGESDPEDIIRSLPRGLYCANFGGRPGDITGGNFVFSARRRAI